LLSTHYDPKPGNPAPNPKPGKSGAGKTPMAQTNSVAAEMKKDKKTTRQRLYKVMLVTVGTVAVIGGGYQLVITLRDVQNGNVEKYMATPDGTLIKVVSMNLLSEKYSETSKMPRPAGFVKNLFGYTPDEYLEVDYRMKLFKSILEKHMQDNAIFCFQEMSHTWRDRFMKEVFAAKGYSLYGDDYGKADSGFMGCYIAYPNSRFNKVKERIVKPGQILADLTTTIAALNSDSATQTNAAQTTAATPESKQPRANTAEGNAISSWSEVITKRNTAPFLMLQDRNNQDRLFGVISFHAPQSRDSTVVGAPMVVILQEAERFFADVPYVLGIDYNSLPNSAVYRRTVDPPVGLGSRSWADLVKWDEKRFKVQWTPTVTHRLTDAYLHVTGKHPKFTTCTRTAKGPTGEPSDFRGSIDAEFSHNIDPVAVDKLPEDETRFIPDATHPSDHYFLSVFYRWKQQPQMQQQPKKNT
jgi:hypothetical protein